MTVAVHHAYRPSDTSVQLHFRDGFTPLAVSVEVNAAWARSGQEWRISRALRDATGQASTKADGYRRMAADTLTEVASARALAAAPFPQAGELIAANLRRDNIEAAIKATVEPDGAETEAA